MSLTVYTKLSDSEINRSLALATGIKPEHILVRVVGSGSHQVHKVFVLDELTQKWKVFSYANERIIRKVAKFHGLSVSWLTPKGVALMIIGELQTGGPANKS